MFSIAIFWLEFQLKCFHGPPFLMYCKRLTKSYVPLNSLLRKLPTSIIYYLPQPGSVALKEIKILFVSLEAGSLNIRKND